MSGKTQLPKKRLSGEELDRLAMGRLPQGSVSSTRSSASSFSLNWNQKGWHSLAPEERAHLRAIMPAFFLSAILTWAVGKPQAFFLFYPVSLISFRKGIDPTEFPATAYHERMLASLPGTPDTGILRPVLHASHFATAVLPVMFIILLVVHFASR